jgi:hypothetical protein
MHIVIYYKYIDIILLFKVNLKIIEGNIYL